MATKTYFVSMKNHRIDSGFSGSDFNPTAQQGELTGVVLQLQITIGT